MNINYIKTLSEAYMIKTQSKVQEKIDPNDLFEHFYDSLKGLREEYPNLYFDLYEKNKFQQERIFSNFFDSVYFEDEIFRINEFTEDEIDEIVEELNEIHKEYEKTGKIILEDGGVSSVGLTMSLLSNPWFGIPVLVTVFLLRKPISRSMFYTINKIYGAIQKIGKFLMRAGGQNRLAYKIIEKNTQECYKSCEFDPKDASVSSFLFQKSKGSIGREIGTFLSTDDNYDKMMCLRQCYVHQIKENVKLQFSLFFTCLRNTGDISKLPNEKDLTAFQVILKNSNFSNACDPMRDACIKSLDTFNDIMEIMYGRNEQKDTRKHESELMNDVFGLQKDSQRGRGEYIPKKPEMNQMKRQEKRYFKPKSGMR